MVINVVDYAGLSTGRTRVQDYCCFGTWATVFTSQFTLPVSFGRDTVSMPGEVKYPTWGKCVICRSLPSPNDMSHDRSLHDVPQ